MTRVLLVCPEPLGHKQPAGIGIRFLEMANVLRGDGHAVTLLSRDDITPQALAAASTDADVAVIQGHVANDFFAHARPVPTVVDLYDPFIVENLHYYAARGAEVFLHDHATLVRSLARGDLFLCASEAQRLFYAGMLLAVDRLNPVTFERDPRIDSLLAIAPFGVQPPRRSKVRAASSDVLFGGIYDWYDPRLAIDATAAARARVPDITLTFNSHPNPDITPQGKTREAIDYVRQRGFDAFVRFEPWVGYEQRGAFLDRFAAALITFPQSLETDLSMRTRVYDYLWAGLPIVTSSAPGTDEVIRKYGAGIIVRSDAAADFADALVRAVGPEHDRLAAGTEHFVAAHQWSDTLAPLRRFCREPRFDTTRELFATTMTLPERPPSILDRIRRRIGGNS